MLSYERQNSSFKIILTGDTIVNITEESLYHYFSPYISRDLFEFAANFSLYEIPGHVLVILVIICLYSRDGMLMKKQVRQQLKYNQLVTFGSLCFQRKSSSNMTE